MPASCATVDGILRLDLKGEYTTEDLRTAFSAAIDDPAFCDPALAGSVPLLMDVSQSTSLSERSASEVERMARFLGEHGDYIDHRLAIVVQNPVHFGLMRIGSAHAEFHQIDVELFTTVAAAKAWLVPGQEDPI